MSVDETLVIGVGQEHRGDDAVGLLVARRVAGAPPGNLPALRVLEHGGDGMDLLLAWEGARSVVVVDAVVSGGHRVGDVHRFDARREPLPSALFAAHSTHALGVADAIELARAMERLPDRMVVYGIESACFDTGSRPGPEVLAAVDTVAERVLDEIEGEAARDA
jgi:hydrogenase maturation protease